MGLLSAMPYSFLNNLVWIEQFIYICLLIGSNCSKVGFSSAAFSPCSSTTVEVPTPQTILPLQHCTSIGGSLRISYLTNACCIDKNCSLPNLVEIVGSLVIEQSTCKTSLSLFLPLLTVIRGWSSTNQTQLSPLEQYSLSIRHTTLIGIGLHHLRVLGEPQIALWDNPALCYVNTIHWASLAHQDSWVDTNGSPPSLGIANPSPDSNPFCPDLCPDHCQTRNIYPTGCWSATVCQAGCSLQCTKAHLACHLTDPNQCCDPECLGACNGPGPDACVTCKHVYHDGRCLIVCPSGYLQLQHRCISRMDCLQFNTTSPVPAHYSIEGTMCVPHCSPGHLRSAVGECVPCHEGECHEKECGHVVIYGTSDLDQVRGCSSVKSLLISLEECHDASEANLFDAFQELREIFGSLNVVHSDALSTLNFLRNLRIIHGLASDSVTHATKEPRASLEIIWNRQLKQLWHVMGSLTPHNRVVIRTGTLLFSLNRNLCPEDIRTFVDTYIEMDRELTSLELELIATSNGESALCSPQLITVYDVSTKQHAVDFVVDIPSWSDPRQVLPVTLHYRVVQHTRRFPWNESTCASGWAIREPICNPFQSREDSDAFRSLKSSDADAHQHCRLGQLQPATIYEAFIEILTILNHEGALSSWFRFNTLPGTPSAPLRLLAYSADPHAVTLTWAQPSAPNGPIIAYHIWYQALTVKITAGLQHRAETCTTETIQSHPRDLDQPTMEMQSTTSFASSNLPQQSCTSCALMCQQTKLQAERAIQTETADPSAQLERIIFEDRLQNFLLTPRSGYNFHRRRSLSDVEITEDTSSTNHWPPDAFADKLPFLLNTDAVPQFIRVPAQPAGTGKLTVEQLRHYTDYIFGVTACHAPHDRFGRPLNEQHVNMSVSVPWCSSLAVIFQKTKKISDKDMLDASMVKATVSTAPPNADQTLLYMSAEFGLSRESSQLSKASNFSLLSYHVVKIEWYPPPDPNGVVLFYWLRYRSVTGNFNGHISQVTAEWSTVCCPGQLEKALSSGSPNSSAMVVPQFIELRNLRPGVYEFQLMMVSLASNGSWTPIQRVELPLLRRADWSAIFNERIYIPVMLSLMVLLVICLVMFWIVHRSFRKRSLRSIAIGSEVNESLLSGLPHEWELTTTDVNWDTVYPLGEGSFGTVYSGILRKFTTPGSRKVLQDIEALSSTKVSKISVAVKTIKPNSTSDDIREFLNEAAFMKNFTNDHIVQMIGILVQQEKPPALIMELMVLGDLANLLRQRLSDGEYAQGSVDPRLAVKWATQIASGMTYLASLELIHRDLAARNCLVNDTFTVKIADFGLARFLDGNQYYRKRGRARLPVRWMSPEALKLAYFTVQSDVWAYGVVIWEIATFAALPFFGLSHEEVIAHVTGGGKLAVAEWPTQLPLDLQSIMLRCWAFESIHRPTFPQILSILAQLNTDVIRAPPV